MRYTVGVKLLSKDGSSVEGLYAIGNTGLSYILTPNGRSNYDDVILVFNDLKEAQAFVKILCKLYRTEFRTRAKSHNLDISQFRIFLLKVDSSNFKFKLNEKRYKKKTEITGKYSSLDFYTIK